MTFLEGEQSHLLEHSMGWPQLSDHMEQGVGTCPGWGWGWESNKLWEGQQLVTHLEPGVRNRDLDLCRLAAD